MNCREFIKKYVEKYPGSEYRDVVKLSLHAAFGAAHFGGPLDGAKLQIEKEYALHEADPTLFPLEEIGEYCRLQLKNPLVRDLGTHAASLFYLSAKEDEKRAGEPEKMCLLRELFKEAEAVFSPSEEDKTLAQSLLESYSKGKYDSVSHSEKYRRLYSPSYRVISKKYARLLPLILDICELSKVRDTVVIALEGRCASGKTTAAGILSELFGAPIIPMDDFFLPFERKTSERLAETAGNIDYERFSAEVIPNLGKNREFTYKAFSCSDGSFYAKTVPSSKTVIVEGVYSMRPEFIGAYDIKAFIGISKKTQLERLEKRDPALLDRFINEWIPMEEKYFGTMGIKSLCDVNIGEM